MLGDTTMADVREMAATQSALNAAVPEPPCGSTVPHGYHNWLEPLGAKECNGVLDPEDSDPARETSTLNSAGDPLKIGDRVQHLADIGQEDRDTGTVTYIGPVEIHGVTVENGCRCNWDGYDGETPHHVDLLTVLL